MLPPAPPTHPQMQYLAEVGEAKNLLLRRQRDLPHK